MLASKKAEVRRLLHIPLLLGSAGSVWGNIPRDSQQKLAETLSWTGDGLLGTHVSPAWRWGPSHRLASGTGNWDQPRHTTCSVPTTFEEPHI